MPSNNPYVPPVKKFENSHEFSYLAEFYKEHETYTNLLPGTYEYKLFWEDVRDKCINGFTNSKGITITGNHFYYLNFCRISGYDPELGKKTEIFPLFMDLDYDYYHMIKYCEDNEKCLLAVKGRRQGWSYKAASICSWEFLFFPGSSSLIGTFLSSFGLTTMQFAIDNLNWANSNTEFRKQRNPDLKDHVMARYQAEVGGVKVWKGYKSQIRTISFKDNPTAAVGKCMAPGTKILMYSGKYKNIEDIRVGDLLMGPDSKCRKVLSTTEGYDTMYRISQEKGEDYIVNSEHKLYLEERGYNKENKIKILNPKEFLKLSKRKQKRTYGIKSNIINFKKQKIKIDPYFLGLWLGDGTSKKPQITSADKEIEEYLKNYAKELNLTITNYCKKDNKAKGISIVGKGKNQNPLWNFMKELKLIGNKHIPFEYKINSEEIRLQLLAGLIDSDGYKVRDTYYEITQVNKELSEDICFLARSLGFHVTSRLKKTSIKDKECRPVYRIFIGGDLYKIPVRLERKKCEKTELKVNGLRTRINIEELGEGKYYGFTLDKDHLFILQDFTITHNSASKLILDEAGVFPNITSTYGYTEPLIRDGSTFSGVAVIFGSSGDMDSGSKHFYEMFIDPKKYNMLEFPDPENPQKSICYFSTAARGRAGICKNPESKWYKQPMLDKDGNSNEEAATDDIMYERHLAKGGLDPRALHSKITQYPLTWKEAFLRDKGAIFASPEMLEWLSKVETTKSIQDTIEIGELVFKENNQLEFQPNANKTYITSFPLKKDEDNTGCIAIFERPEKVNGEVPYSLYVAGCDPYDHDKSGVGSLGSFFVYKRFLKAGSSHDIIVAEVTGRPQFADQFYESCRRLCIYYNCKVLYENNLKNMKGYFEQKNSLHYMWEQPQIIKDIVRDSKVSRGYGIHMQRGQNGASGIKDQCEQYLKDWLYTERDDIDGKKILNLHTIKSIALLKELIAYDIEGNYDRVVAFMLCILQTKELHKIHLDNIRNSPTNFSNDKFLKGLWEKKTIPQKRFNIFN